MPRPPSAPSGWDHGGADQRDDARRHGRPDLRRGLLAVLPPPEVQTTELLAIASVGLVANLAMAGLLHRGWRASLNIESAWLHVLGDGLGSVGVIASGLAIKFTGWNLPTRS